MGCPTHDTCHGENRCIDFLWQTNHFIDKATVEIKICTRWLAASTVFLQTFDTFLLYQLQEIILVFSPLFLGKFTCQALQFNGTWVTQSIDRMTDTINETCLVISLLVEHSLKVSIKFSYITPILDSFFQVVEHIDNLDIGTTMQRTL